MCLVSKILAFSLKLTLQVTVLAFLSYLAVFGADSQLHRLHHLDLLHLLVLFIFILELYYALKYIFIILVLLWLPARQSYRYLNFPFHPTHPFIQTQGFLDGII